MTAEGKENKEDVEFSSVIPIPRKRPYRLTKDNFLTHNDIFLEMKFDPNPPTAGKEWQDKLNRAIVSILKGEAPKSWVNQDDKDDFDRYLDNDDVQTARKMVMWLFVNNLNFDIFDILGIESLIT